ncbi:50S ribosomal protein L18 [bacterium]|nr:50S ribosomal protein L18 [bacterium]
MKKATKKEARDRRHKRVRAKIHGTAQVPRLCVFRSRKYIYAQLIDDEKGRTIVAANDLKLKPLPLQRIKHQNKGEKEQEELLSRKVALAFEVGKLIAQRAVAKKIKRVVFDKGGYKYHGRVRAVAEGARKGGLKF